MNWSPEQQAIFKHFADGDGDLVVEANAGTGKTTTIKEAFNHAPEQRMLYAVFNKKNQVEAAEKIRDRRVDVLTLHSLGFRFIKKVWSNTKPDDAVEAERAVKALTDAGFPKLEADAYVVGVVKLIGFLKNTSIQPTAEQAYQIALDLELVGSSPEKDAKFIQAALAAMEMAKIKDPQGRISFNDMVWLPVAMKWVQPTYELVVVDEAQDMNLPQLTMAQEACRERGRIVVVGDSRQAIYGFRGAVQDGMNMMKAKLNASVLTLSVTYRCPKAVVRLAQKVVPAYQAHESAPEGEVADVTSTKMQAEVKPGDAILSRLNAPLMPLCLNLLRKNIPARIEGRDIGKQLIGLVGKVSKLRLSNARKGQNLGGEVDEFILKLAEYEEREIRRCSAWKNAEKKIEQIQDIVETLKALAGDCNSLREITQRLETLFQDTNQYSRAAVVLSSVHKAKGLEWKRVWMLSDTFRQSKGGEEENIYYVAVTRAQSSLFLVGKAKEEPKPATIPTTTEDRAPIATVTWQMAA